MVLGVGVLGVVVELLEPVVPVVPPLPTVPELEPPTPVEPVPAPAAPEPEPMPEALPPVLEPRSRRHCSRALCSVSWSHFALASVLLELPLVTPEDPDAPADEPVVPLLPEPEAPALDESVDEGELVALELDGVDELVDGTLEPVVAPAEPVVLLPPDMPVLEPVLPEVCAAAMLVAARNAAATAA